MRRLATLAVLLAACGGGKTHEAVGTESMAPTSSSTVVPRPVAPASGGPDSGGPASTTQSPAPDIDAEWFDQTILTDTIGKGAENVQATVVRGGTVLHQLVASSLGSSGEATTTSRFRLASISKVPLAMAVMRLVEDGVVALDDRPLVEVATNFGVALGDPRMADVTVRQLLSHTSGFGAMSDLFFDSPDKTADDAIVEALGTPLENDPGREFTYSNMNYVVLGRLIGWRTGTTWSSSVRRLVLDPLGMGNWIVGTTSGHEDGDVLHESKLGRNYMELLEGAGAWLGTSTDVALMVDSLAEETFFRSPATSRLMRQPSSAGPPDQDWTYGLGLRLFPGGLWGHSGTLEATHDMVVCLPDGTVVAVLVNGEEPSDSDTLIDTIVRALNPPDSANPTTSINS